MSAGKKTTKGMAVGTLRFDIDLAPPTDDTTNEFSYVHLLKEREAAKSNTNNASSLQDPLVSDLDNSDENLVALAKKFEEKYGPRKRKRVLHESDLIDRGLGYDLGDSFVDDSELYENYVPHQLDTRFGGFYINTGKLEFKTADEDDIDDEMDFIVKKKKKAKPRVNTFQSTPQALLASQKLKKAKQRAAMQKNPSSLKKSSSVLNTSSPIKPALMKKHKQDELTKCLIPSNRNAEGSLAASGSPSLSTSSLASTSSQDKAAHNIKPVNLSSKLNKDAARASTADTDAKTSNTASGEMTQVPKEPPVLPDKLPPLLLAKVTDLEQLIIKDKGANGKLSTKARFGYDERLVDIHLHSLGLTKKMRNGMFEYLAYKMGVARGTLIKRLKQEMRKREDTELATDLLNLKKAIDLVMPEQIVLFEKEVRARAGSVSEMEEESKTIDAFDEATNMSAISATQPVGGQEKTKKAPPRKRFKWTEEIKKLLCAVVKTKVASEENISKASKTCSGEEAIGNFLEEKVKPLWPKGWMQKSVLYKTSEVAHKHFTNPLAKKALPKDKPLTSKQPSQQAPQLPVLTPGLTPGQTPSPNNQIAKALSDVGKSAGGGGRTLLVGGGSVIVGGVKSGPSLSKGGAKNVPLAQKPATGSSKGLHTIQPKTATKVVPKLTNTKVVIPKSTASSNPAKSVTTYLLSANSMDIAQLLKIQAQIKQKTGQSVLVSTGQTTTGQTTTGQTTTGQTTGQVKGQSSSQLVPSQAGTAMSSAQDAGSMRKSGLSLSSVKEATITPTATKVTPSIVQPPKPAGRLVKDSVPVLPRHRLTSTENSKLEAVVSSIVSAINTQSPLLTQQASPFPQASAAMEVTSPARLNLTKKDFSPQLIFPAQSTILRDSIKAPPTSSETTPNSGDRAVPSSTSGDHSKGTPRSSSMSGDPLVRSCEPLPRSCELLPTSCEPLPMSTSLPWSSDPLSRSSGGPLRHPIPGVLSKAPHPIPGVLSTASHPIPGVLSTASHPIPGVLSKASHPIPGVLSKASHPIPGVLSKASHPIPGVLSTSPGPAVTPPMSAGHAPIAPMLPAGATPTLAIGGSLGRLTPNASVVSIPDTPPLCNPLPRPQNQQGESPLPLSPSLSSPVEQIFEEHSYLENNSSPFIGTELDTSKEPL